MSQSKNVIILLAPLLLPILLICLEYTGISVVIPSLAYHLQLSLSEIQWCTTSYLLSFAAIVLVGGRLGDLYGHSTLLGSGLFIFILLLHLLDLLQMGLLSLLQGLFRV